MAVEIIVSAEELIKTMEYVSLISGAAPGKKKDDSIKQTAGVMKITAVSPRKDKSYMLMFECIGAAEQLLYRMEGKSFYSNDMVMAVVDAKSFMTLVKTFANDVSLVFDEKYLGVNCNSSHYKVSLSSMELPPIKIPENGHRLTLSTDFLTGMYRFCAVACAKNDAGRPAFRCIQLNLRADGSAVCYATDSKRLAKYVNAKAGGNIDISFLMTPNVVAHITDLCDENEIVFIPTEKAIYVTSPRFDYMCYKVDGVFPDCERIFTTFKPIQTVVADKGKLLAAVSRAIIFSGDNEALRIKFATDKENFYVNTESVSGSGLDAVPLDSCTGSDDKVHYVSGITFSKLLYNCGSEKVAISTSSPLAPTLITIPESENCYIMSAMR